MSAPQDRLFRAIENGDVEALRSAAREIPDLNVLRSGAMPALIQAIVTDQSACFAELIALGADVAQSDPVYYWTPLMWIANDPTTRDDFTMLDAALKAGAELENPRLPRNEYGRMPLAIALYVESWGVARRLMQAGARKVPADRQWFVDAVLALEVGDDATLCRLLEEDTAQLACLQGEIVERVSQCGDASLLFRYQTFGKPYDDAAAVRLMKLQGEQYVSADKARRRRSESI